MALKAEEIKQVKGEGFLLNRGTECFNGRIITENGTLTARQMVKVGEAAEKFGSGTVALTTRMTVEVPGIPYEKIPDFQAFLAEEGMVTGGTGAKVRPIIVCKGTTCVFGLYDTQGLARDLHKLYYEGYHSVPLPHKFKIGVGGCPNNCCKPDLNDIGIVGQRVPVLNLEKCRGCKVCQVEQACPLQAASLEEGKLALSRETCNHCGRCIGSCPFGAVAGEETRYKVYAGGRWGKQVRIGTPLSRLFTREEVIALVEKAILLFKREGLPGERFGMTVERLGLERTEALLCSDQLLTQKAEILAK